RYRYHGERLTEVINASGQPLTLDYDDAGRITGWTDRNDCWYRYTYDAEGRCVRTEGSGGSLSATFHYDLDNAITHVTDSLGHTTAYLLDDDGQVVREIDPHGAETHSEWDEHRRLLSRTDPLGRTTSYEYDEDGNVASVIRPDGSRIRAEYNDLRLPITLIAPDGAITRNEYDERGNLTRSVDPADAATVYGYDDRGHLAHVTDALDSTRRIDTDAAGLPIAITDPDGSVTRYDRDAFGRITATTDPLGGVTRLGWTIDGNLAWRTLPDGATERWFYDGEGNLRTHVDPLEQTTHTEVTHFDLLAAEVRPDGTRLKFAYDTELRLSSVTNQQGLVWRYEYDAAGNLVQETDFNDRAVTYTYDAAGQLISRTNGIGQTTTFVRNAVGDVAERRTPDDVATFHHDELGRLVAAADLDTQISFQRDEAGRVLVESVNGRAVTSAYDALGRRVRRWSPSGAVSVWEYNASHQPVALHAGDRTLRFEYDAAGQEISRALGAGAVLTQEWNANHQLLAQRLTGTGGGNLQQRSYKYRQDGLLAGIDDALSGSRTFDLDRVGRVTTVRARGWSERYVYDSAGNVTDAEWPSPEGAGDSPTGGAADAESVGTREYSGTLIRHAGKVRYEHDAQGRLVLRRQKRLSGKPVTWRYFWDADDRLTGVITPDGTRWRYRYDPLGRRVAKQRLAPDHRVVEQVDFTWDGVVLAEQAHTDGVSNGPDLGDARVMVWDYEPGTFRPLTQRERSPLRDAPQQWIDEQFHAIVTDLVGSPAELINDEGGIDSFYRTTLWGRPLERMPADAYTPLRFPGQYHDAETGLDYNLHRHYDPAIGRYSSGDILGLSGGLQPHSYVHNPHAWIDPLGLTPCPALRQRMRDNALDSVNGRHRPDGSPVGDTHAGRAYQKHMNRPGTSLIPISSGKDRAGMAEHLVDDLLTNPRSAVQSWTHGQHGPVHDVLLRDIGARWAQNGDFIGFLD
ncbi:MAG: type IV secretion protein Rhs, partial [Saccharopolyspora sp.]|uniref:RHS repeat-associated core domain-containing protein n=1 Tax=Saccharopolyspora sp. TaxID=33915 RepID=UPI0025CC35C1